MKHEHENKSFNQDRETKAAGRPDKQDSRGKVDNAQHHDGGAESKAGQEGNNNNPEGANQYTHGRHVDAGAEQKQEAQAFDTLEQSTQQHAPHDANPAYMQPTVEKHPNENNQENQ